MTTRHLRKALLAAGLAAVTAVALPAAPTLAEDLTVIGHAVHQRTTTEGEGGNVVAEWTEETGAGVEWLTFGVTPIHERLFREASLDQGVIDVAFLLNRFTNENVINLFEPLDDYIANDPIPDFEGISPGMVDAFTFDGKVYGIPFRHATHGLFFNKALLAEKGFDRPPESFAEVIEYARALTYTRDDGTKVHGIIWGGTGPANLADVVRVHGGDFITDDLEVMVNSEGTVAAISLLADFYKEGVLPQAFINFTTEDAITFMQQGRAAMAVGPFGRYRPFNDPEASKFPGEIDVMAIPGFSGDTQAAAKTEVWALSIPANSPNKDLAWSFVKHLSTLDAATRAAVNGNGPVRAGAYNDPRVKDLVIYAAAEAAAVETARVPLPGFEKSAQADDAIKEEVQAALLGAKSAQQAMDDLQRRLERLIGN